MKSRPPSPSTSPTRKTIRNWPIAPPRPAPKSSAKPWPANRPLPPCSPTAANPPQPGHAGPCREARTHRKPDRAHLRTRGVSDTHGATRGRREADRASSSLLPDRPHATQLRTRKEVRMNEKHQTTPHPENEPDTGEQRETEPRPVPAIYVASLAEYNNGVLHGAWIDAARNPEEIQTDINALLP